MLDSTSLCKFASAFPRRLFTAAPVLLALTAAPVAAQVLPHPEPTIPSPTAPLSSFSEEDNRSGPRVGAAYLVGGSVTAERQGRSFAPLTSLFGWQFERQFKAGPNLPVPMTEMVMLVGGIEQGTLLPSLSWLVGARRANGWEAAIGPTLTGAGLQLAVAAGMTHAFGPLNVPINLAVAPGRRGASISLTTGFNTKRRS